MPFVDIRSPTFLARPNAPFIIPKITMQSLFSDNSRAYYKVGSLASGGVGTVRNARRKWKHT